MLSGISLVCRDFILVLFLILPRISYSQVNFGPQAQFRYLKGSEAATLPSSWKNVGYDDGNWQVGVMPFRYGDGAGGTVLTDMQNTYSTVYMRASFTATDIHLIPLIQLGVDYDDGFIIWINGKLFYSINAPASPTYQSFSTDLHESGAMEFFPVDSSEVFLVEGENTIAIQGFNTSLESSDFLIDVSLFAEKDDPSIPSSSVISFSKLSGIYTSPFNLGISTNDNSTKIFYTLDGSHPDTSPSAISAGTGASVLIDPASTSGRGTTPGVVIRACLKKEGYKSTFPVSKTYIFSDALRVQGYPGGNWPNYDVNGQIIYYNIDQNITNGGTYGSQFSDALNQVPVISIVTDNENLFDPSTGIYVNAGGHGFEWERESSVELFNTGTTDGFHVNAGLRIRGGWSRHNDFPKHSFRLFFRSVYGDPKLNYPLFGDEGVDHYDKIDLRTAQNYAWSNGRSGNTMVREVFSRDAQGAMGQPYSRSRYYHLFINGMYWGIFQSQERTEARFASDYMGGKTEDYDVVKVNTEDWSYRVEATDGSLDGWQNIYDRVNSGFSDNASYFEMEGKDALGNPNGTEVLLDIDNLIDYMVAIFYTGNFDSPTSSFGRNKGPNNFFAIDNREDKSAGYRFFLHDCEHALFYEPGEGYSIGIEEDRVNIGTRTDDFRMTVTDFLGFHPQWLHFKLSDNNEYRVRFADRAYKHLRLGGVFSEERALEIFNRRVAEIDDAIILESARWGWGYFTRDVDWYNELNSVRYDFFPERPFVVMDQLKEAGLWTTLKPPAFENNQGIIPDEVNVLESTESLKLVNYNSGGSICYTTNGMDPRKVGGEIYERTLIVQNGFEMSIDHSAVIKARIYDGGEWSALSEIKFLKSDEDYSNLKITELHYHPIDRLSGSDTIYGEDYEFIEFKNTGNYPINLTGLHLDSAVMYQFPDNEVLPPKQFFVIASKPGVFYDFHGMIPSGNYKNNLSNSGERLVLEDKDHNEIINFVYDDIFPWPFAADGGGKSMVAYRTNPLLSPGDPAYWVESANIEGSPFKDDPDSEVYVVNHVQEFSLILYPNPTSDYFILKATTPDTDELYTVTIYNMNGSRVYNADATAGEKIYLGGSGLTTGIYIVDVKGRDLHQKMKLVYSR